MRRSCLVCDFVWVAGGSVGGEGVVVVKVSECTSASECFRVCV